jgi:hypothetical protein
VGRETNRQRREKQAATAREKAASARANQARADQRRRAKTILSSVVAVAVVIAIIVVVAVTRPVNNNPAGDRTSARPTVVTGVTDVSSSTTDQVAQGNASLSAVKAISDPALTDNGKPELLFVGAEFCPFCAAERWSMVNALSRFGTFTNLNQIRSATDDGNLATFSFYKSSYTSKYLSFVPVEDEDRDQKQLETPTKAQDALWAKYTGHSFPFMDFGGQYVVTNAGYPDTDLTGLNWTQITADLKDPSSTVGKDILGEANVLTAMICKLTNNQPANVCSAAGVSKVALPQPSA